MIRFFEAQRMLHGMLQASYTQDIVCFEIYRSNLKQFYSSCLWLQSICNVYLAVAYLLLYEEEKNGHKDHKESGQSCTLLQTLVAWIQQYLKSSSVKRSFIRLCLPLMNFGRLECGEGRIIDFYFFLNLGSCWLDQARACAETRPSVIMLDKPKKISQIQLQLGAVLILTNYSSLQF